MRKTQGLTEREKEVVREVFQGGSGREAAMTLNMTVRTLNAHLQTIYRLLNLRNRLELVKYCYDHPDGQQLVKG